jgi:hypothetical protein
MRAGLVTGPRLKNTSHSALEVIKKFLLGLPQFKDMAGSHVYLNFGTALHEAFLEDKYGDAYNTLDDHDKQKIKNMTRRLNNHPVVKALMKESVREDKFIVDINGVPVAVVLDSKQPPLKRGFDLKTTSCKNQKTFVEKGNSIGYPRQGLTYVKAAKLKQFYFVAIDKEPPHNIYIYNLNDYPNELKYAEKELEFLLYFYKHYGKMQDPDKPETSGESGGKNKNNNLNAMAKNGKEALQEIKEAATKHKENKKASATAAKLETKSKDSVVKLVNKFPAKEKELYQEKLDQIIAGL